LDLLIGLVIAIFIITAVFVGFHASQEPHEKMAESHTITLETQTLNQMTSQTTFVKLTMHNSY